MTNIVAIRYQVTSIDIKKGGDPFVENVDIPFDPITDFYLWVDHSKGFQLVKDKFLTDHPDHSNNLIKIRYIGDLYK